MEQTPNPYPQEPQHPENNEKQRHGCVTAWLILLIVVNSIVVFVNLFAKDILAEAMPYNVSPTLFYLLAFMSALNVVFASSLFQWKRWGFYGFIGTAIAAVMINLKMGQGIVPSLSGLLGIAVLFAILQIRKNDISAWDQME